MSSSDPDSFTMMFDSMDGTTDLSDLDMDHFDFSQPVDVSDQSMSSTHRSTSEGSKSTQFTNAQQQQQQQQPGFKKPLTGRPPVLLALSCDYKSLSEYQVNVRKNVEMFEANQKDVESSAQGRNHKIVLGQVGIRCLHCRHLPPNERTRASTYFPSKLAALYQAVQNLAVTHLMQHCEHVPAKVLDDLIRQRDQKSAAGTGKMEWARRAHALGVYEDENGLRFADRLDAFVSEVAKVDY